MEMESSTSVRPAPTYIDQGWAWVILVACTSIMIILQGNVRSFGIFAVEIQREFNTSASSISSLLSAQAIANCIAAFLVLNVLSKVVTLRVLIITGCLFSASCFILDSQIKNINYFIAFHILHGMGIAFMYGPNLVTIGQYFCKYRGTANALISCGASVGQFALSPLFSYLVVEFGLKGALLLNASIYFQCIVFAMFLRPTSYFHQRSASRREDNSVKDALIVRTNDGINQRIDTEKEKEYKEKSQELQPMMEEDETGRRPKETKSLKQNLEEVKDNQNLKTYEVNESRNSQNSGLSKSEIIELGLDSYKNENETKSCFAEKHFCFSALKKLFANVDCKLLRKKIFITYFFGSSISQIASSIPQAFFPSFAEDIGLDRKQGMLFVAIAGFADLGGRILTTLIADRKCLNRSRFLGIVLVVHGIVACFIPFYRTFPTFSAYCVLYGACGGIVFAISTTILTDYIGIDRLSQGLGLMLFLNGFASAGSYLLVGFLREKVGSYDLGFVLNGVGLIVSGILFCAETCISYKKH